MFFFFVGHRGNHVDPQLQSSLVNDSESNFVLWKAKTKRVFMEKEYPAN